MIDNAPESDPYDQIPTDRPVVQICPSAEGQNPLPGRMEFSRHARRKNRIDFKKKNSVALLNIGTAPLFFTAISGACLAAIVLFQAPAIEIPLAVAAFLCILSGWAGRSGNTGRAKDAGRLFFRFPSRIISTGDNKGIRKFIEAAPSPVILVDGLSHHIIAVNKNAQEFFGSFSPDIPVTNLIEVPALRQTLSASIKTGQRTRINFQYKEEKNRENRPLEAYISPIGDNLVLLFIEDVSLADRLDKMRSDFIANVSHELRTPLTAIMGYVETLQGHARNDEAVREKFLGLMYAQAQRMLRLVRDLMSLSKIELDENKAPTEILTLTEIVSEVVDSLQPVINHYQGDVRITINEQDTADLAYDIPGVRDEMIQVVQNLIDNALKYAGDTPEIEVIIGHGVAPSLGPGSLRTGERAVSHIDSGGMPGKPVYMQVRDNGLGINRADLPRLTERFYRVNVEKSRLRGGTGLGLAIVKHAINRHNGALQIETRDGVGSAFTCYFTSAGRDEQSRPRSMPPDNTPLV